MKQEEINLKSTDGLSLKGFAWFSNDKAIGTVLIVHGLGEHFGRYKHVAKIMITNNFNVVVYDQRGHGLSEGKRGHSPSQNQLLDDLSLFVSYCKESFNNDLFVYGHSFGGNVLTTYLLKRETSHIKAVVISSAWLKLAFTPSAFKVALAKIMNYIWPSFSQENDIDSNDLTYVDDLNLQYGEDDLVHSRISASLFLNAHMSAEWCLKNANKLTTQSLIIHGEDDPIVSPEGSKLLHQNSTCSTIKIWSKTKHEPHNDLRREEIITFVCSWFKSIN